MTQAVLNVPRFNALAAYERERDENRRLFDLLTRSTVLMRGMADRLERYGEDVTEKRAFMEHASKARFEA